MKLSRLILSLLIISFSAAGCIDLASNNDSYKVEARKNHKYSKGEVYAMRGGLGGVFSIGMNRLEDKFEKEYHIHSYSTVWYKSYALSKFIIENYKSKDINGPIILVGQSLGANDQIKVAEALNQAHIPVALLITVDAVSPKRVPPNVAAVLNIYKPSYVPMFSGQLVQAVDPTKTHVENFNITKSLDVYVNHFTIVMSKEIQQIMIDRILAILKAANKKGSL